jgi:hypothetical protein
VEEAALMTATAELPVSAESQPVRHSAARVAARKAPAPVEKGALMTAAAASIQSSGEPPAGTPSSSMPVIPVRRQKAHGKTLCLSTSDILTPITKKRQAHGERSASKKKRVQGSKPAAVKKCPICEKVQPGARQKKCTCGHDFQAIK